LERLGLIGNNGDDQNTAVILAPFPDIDIPLANDDFFTSLETLDPFPRERGSWPGPLLF
jgi:hypothetical protein